MKKMLYVLAFSAMMSGLPSCEGRGGSDVDRRNRDMGAPAGTDMAPGAPAPGNPGAPSGPGTYGGPTGGGTGGGDMGGTGTGGAGGGR